MDDPNSRRIGPAGEDLGLPDDTTSYGRTAHACHLCSTRWDQRNCHQQARRHMKEVHSLIVRANCGMSCRMRVAVRQVASRLYLE